MQRTALSDPGRVHLDSRLLTAEDVGKLLCLPVSTIYELARSGRLPCLRIGRAVRFYRQDIEGYLTGECRVPGTRGTRAS